MHVSPVGNASSIHVTKRTAVFAMLVAHPLQAHCCTHSYQFEANSRYFGRLRVQSSHSCHALPQTLLDCGCEPCSIWRRERTLPSERPLAVADLYATQTLSKPCSSKPSHSQKLPSHLHIEQNRFISSQCLPSLPQHSTSVPSG